MRRRMVEHSALDIMCPNRFCRRPERGTRMCARIRQSLCVDYPQRNAQVLSAQYGANVLLLGAALMLATTHHSAVREWHVLALLCGVMMLQLLWMMWYVLVRDRHGSAHADKDKHATTCWVRGGLTLLALLSLVMDVFRIGLYVGFSACVSAVLGAYPVIHAAHTIAQVHFLWFHIKDVIKSFQTFERFGVIHAVVTNLLLWGSGVMSEAEHFLNNHNKRVSAPSLHGNHSTDPPCNCSTSTCSVFSSSLFYLYPFNIEFHIFVSAMLFVMWKNIGRSVETVSAPLPPQGRGLGRGLSVGPVLGCGALACTVGVLVVYLTHVEQADTRQAAVSMFYVYGVVMSLSMCGAASAGLLLYRAQQRPLDTSTNPARELDTELLVWSAAGAWLMAWCSVIAVISGSSPAPHRWISGVYATLLVLETSVQNLFIMESLYRPQECESAPASEVFSVTCALAPPYGSLRGGIINRAYETQERPLEEPEDSAHVYRRKPSQVPLSADLTPPPRLKRNVLKNIALFLTLANVCLWILPAFGVRPQYDSGLEEDSFGFSVWVSVLNFAIPLNLFYRMHAVASLFEVFRRI